MHVLIIDDDAEVLEYLGMFLKNFGHRVSTAPDGERGMAMLKEKQPDLVLLDLVLPEQGGLVLLKEIREFNRHLPVVAITAYRDVERIIESFRLGVFDCLLKPFNSDYLLKTVIPKVEAYLKANGK